MKFINTPIAGLIIIEPTIFHDERGSFIESYNKEQFFAAGIDVEFIQDNQSISKINVIRGLHFQQDPKAQGKLVRVAKGRAFDVAVDIRPDSPTYGRHFSLELNSTSQVMMWIPPGFAHGFQYSKRILFSVTKLPVLTAKSTKEEFVLMIRN